MTNSVMCVDDYVGGMIKCYFEIATYKSIVQCKTHKKQINFKMVDSVVICLYATVRVEWKHDLGKILGSISAYMGSLKCLSIQSCVPVHGLVVLCLTKQL